MRMRHVIVGNSYAALGAIEAIRSIDRRSSITVISDEPDSCYARPLITFWLGGSVTTEKMFYRPRDFYQRNEIETLLGRKAVAIDVGSKEVILAGGDRIAYDKLLITTGGRPFIPPIEGLSPTVRNVHTFTRWEDARALKELSRSHRRAVVVGGGLIGLKAAEGLNDAGVETTIVKLGPRVLALALDEISGCLAAARLNENGIKAITQTTVSKVVVNGAEEVTSVILRDGTQLPCEILVIAVGVRPNVELAKTADLAVERGIVTDQTLRTTVADIYAAGDVAQNLNLLTGKPEVIAIVPVAYEQGRIAGRNMAGLQTVYHGAIPMNSVEIYGLPIMSMGITNPLSTDHREIVYCDNGVYKKYVFEEDRLIGALLVGDVEYGGVLTHLIRSGRRLSPQMTEALLSGDLLALVVGPRASSFA